MSEKILVLDDDSSMRFFLKETLNSEYDVSCFADGLDALAALKKERFKVIVTDVKMPRIDGISFLEEAMKLCPEAVPIIITAYGQERVNVKGVRDLAYSYLTKPFDPAKIRSVVKEAFKKYGQEPLLEEFSYKEIIGKNPHIQEVKELILRVSQTPVTVLIQGESGTGKELIAKAIHYCSYRKTKPFIGISCSAIPDTLLESELFGYEKGAFTGADVSKPGKFEAADEGTLFLDEIGDMSLVLQAKLLRILEERSFERLGALKPISVDVRIIAATNKDLDVAVQTKEFRQDLYYRLNVVCIKLPPLRDRKDDIPLLVEHFINRFNRSFQKAINHISIEAMEILVNYPWPGNIRELENIIQRAAVLEKTDTLTKDSLPSGIVATERTIEIDKAKIDTTKPLDRIVDDVVSEVEKKVLMEYLNKFKGNKKAVAEALNISRKGLYNKLKKYDIS